MSIQLALLKSGEEVIADIKEFRDSDGELVSYLFSNPHAIKIKTSKVLMEGEEKQRNDIVYHRWMPLSKETDIIVNKDWIVCITDPIDQLTKTFEEKMDGRDRSANGHDDGSINESNVGGTLSPTVVLNE